MEGLNPAFNESVQALSVKYQQVFEKVNNTLQEAQAKLKLQSIFDLVNLTTPSQRHQSKEKLKYFESHLTKVKVFADTQVKNYVEELKPLMEQLEPQQRNAFFDDILSNVAIRNEQRYMEYYIQQQWTVRLRELLDFFDDHQEAFKVVDNRLSFNDPETLAAYKIRLFQVDSLANLARQLGQTPASPTQQRAA